MDGLKAELTKKADDLQKHFEDLEVESKRQKEQEPIKGKSLMDQAEGGLLKLKETLKAKSIGMKDMWKNSSQYGEEVGIDLKAVSNITTGYALTGANANIMRAFDTEPRRGKRPLRRLCSSRT